MFEVKCVLREGNYSDSVVLQSVRGSLKGKARSLLLSLSEHASPQQILDKLEGVYGNVYTSEALLEEFYKETQQQNQTVADFGMTLESIIQPAVEKDSVKLDDILKKIDRMGKRLDTLEKKTPEEAPRTTAKSKNDMVSKPRTTLLDRMIGKSNETHVYVNGKKCKSLIDSGSMVSTISEPALRYLHPVPTVKTLDEFILSVRVAEGFQ
ncbi:uncharacterized protein LOC134727828 [Mytilus trossulus]|uniref:uncharacterized protein LOC134727828 n=1 Tax=Mytilus trossulus TaxID=6551 RepID=UPI003005B38C